MTGNENYEFFFTKMNVTEGAIATVAIVDKRNPDKGNGVTEETLVITASVKPFINVLWIGTVVLVMGFIVSIFRRRKELNS